MVFITIEGADNVGKTTLAQYLTEVLNFRTHHFTAPKDEEDGKMQYFNFISQHQNDDYILDRSWIGEFVWGPRLREYWPTYSKQLRALVNTTRTLNILLYVPLDFYNVILKSGEDKFDEVQNTNLMAIQRNFLLNYDQCGGQSVAFNVSHFRSKLDFCQAIHGFVYRWLGHSGTQTYQPLVDDYSLTLYDDQHRFIPTGVFLKRPIHCDCVHFRDHCKHTDYGRQRQIPTFGAGNTFNPRYIFIGEAPGTKGCGKTGIPFYNDKSGMYLRELMFKYHITETQCYMTNVVKCNPLNNKLNKSAINICGKTLEYEIETIQQQTEWYSTIIAVGRTAEQWCRDHNYFCKYLRHPASPFYTGDFANYEQEFRRVFEIA